MVQNLYKLTGNSIASHICDDYFLVQILSVIGATFCGICHENSVPYKERTIGYLAGYYGKIIHSKEQKKAPRSGCK